MFTLFNQFLSSFHTFWALMDLTLIMFIIGEIYVLRRVYCIKPCIKLKHSKTDKQENYETYKLIKLI